MDGSIPTTTYLAEPKVRYGGGKLGWERREGFRQSHAKRDDVSKDDIEFETRHLTISIDRSQTPPIPGSMSTIPLLPSSAAVSSPRSTTTPTTTTQHARFTVTPTPETTAATTTTTSSGRPRFFASGRPHPGGNRGSANSFFRTHGPPFRPPPTLPVFAITLIVIGAVFVLLGAIATIFCCRGAFRSFAPPFLSLGFP